MKIGPLNITRNGSKPTTREIGSTGTEIFGGRLGTVDYNAELQAPESYNIYDKMRNDGQVQAALAVIKLPLINADWKVERASDRAQDRMIAEVIEEDFLPIWRGYGLRQALLSLDYGSMPLEQVWTAEPGGLIRLAKLGPRLPKSITEWHVDRVGDLTEIIQQAAPDFRPIAIPAAKLLLFVNDLEGSNYQGRSILRAAYKHWYYKDNLYRVQAIAIEKRAMGVDVGILKGDAQTLDKRREFEAALQTLHVAEKQYIVISEDQQDYKLEGGNATGLLNPQEAIEHHDLRIVRSMIAEFVAMGAGSTGSLAMHRDKTSYLLLALGAIADTICETVRTQLFTRWVGYNWAGADVPHLRYTRLEQRNIKDFAESVKKLVGSGALTADEGLEEESRDLLSLPERIGPKAEPEPETVEEMPTEEMVSMVRMLRSELKKRRVDAEIGV